MEGGGGDGEGLVETFVAITGAPVETAIYFLEMSGYSLDTAVQFYFEGGQGFDQQPVVMADPSTGNPNDNNLMRVLFQDRTPPDSWLCQGLAFDYHSEAAAQDWTGIGICQLKNGPCGVLVAFQATVIANLMNSGRLSPSARPTDEDLAQAITDICFLCKGSRDSVSVCTWADPVNGIGQSLEVIETPVGDDGGRDSVNMIVFSVLDQFKAPGGVILLALSAILTTTVERIQQFGTELPLSVGQFHICSSALVQMLLNGCPDDNISAYAHTGVKRAPTEHSKVGLLSGMEIEQKFLVRDELKFPSSEVYVLHGRDHFTLAFIPSPGPPTSQFQLVHWNGLPPGGPRITVLEIHSQEGVRTPAPETAAEGVGIEYKPTPNTIDSIVQADPADKAQRPKEWRSWTYEVALVIDDPSNQSPIRPSHLPPLPTFRLKDSDLTSHNFWRCRACYETRFQTMCFGINSDTSAYRCQHCGGNRSAVGWTTWMKYEELPGSWRRYLDRQHGPQVITILRTKWPGCEVIVRSSDGNVSYPSV